MELVESLSADEALSENKSAKAALDDMKLLLQFVGLFDITRTKYSAFRYS